MIEKRLLQIAVSIACLVPLVTGALSIVRGPGWMGHMAAIPRDLDSHYRYLSGIFFALGVAFTTCVPGIERKGPRFRLLGAMVVTGGLARLASAAAVGWPSAGHRFGFAMELGVTPLLMLWQARLARRAG